MWDTWKSRQQSAIQEIISVSTCWLSHGAEHQLSLCWYLHQLSHLFKPVALHPDLPRSLSPPACMCRYQEAVILTGTRHHWDRWAFGFLRRLPLSCQAYLYCHFQYEQNYAGTNPDGVRNMKCSAVAGILEILSTTSLTTTQPPWETLKVPRKSKSMFDCSYHILRVSISISATQQHQAGQSQCFTRNTYRCRQQVITAKLLQANLIILKGH